MPNGAGTLQYFWDHDNKNASGMCYDNQVVEMKYQKQLLLQLDYIRVQSTSYSSFILFFRWIANLSRG